MTNFYMACGCAALAFALGFVFTWLIGFQRRGMITGPKTIGTVTADY